MSGKYVTNRNGEHLVCFKIQFWYSPRKICTRQKSSAQIAGNAADIRTESFQKYDSWFTATLISYSTACNKWTRVRWRHSWTNMARNQICSRIIVHKFHNIYLQFVQSERNCFLLTNGKYLQANKETGRCRGVKYKMRLSRLI